MCTAEDPQGSRWKQIVRLEIELKAVMAFIHI